jgi:hypothetical protein
VQVVVLDHVGVLRAHHGGEPADEVGLGRVALPFGLQRGRGTVRVADSHEEDAAGLRVEPRGLEVQLHAHERVEREVAEVGAPRGDQVLLLRREREDRVCAEVAHVGEPSPHATGCSGEDGSMQGTLIVPMHAEAERPGAFERLVGEGRATRIGGGHRRESVAQMHEVFE